MTLTEARDWALEEAARWIRSVRDDGIVEDDFKDEKDRVLVKRELGGIAFELLGRAGIQACRMCGCSQDDACEGGCSWVAADLCSACAPPAPAKNRRKVRSRK